MHLFDECMTCTHTSLDMEYNHAQYRSSLHAEEELRKFCCMEKIAFCFPGITRKQYCTLIVNTRTQSDSTSYLMFNACSNVRICLCASAHFGNLNEAMWDRSLAQMCRVY